MNSNVNVGRIGIVLFAMLFLQSISAQHFTGQLLDHSSQKPVAQAVVLELYSGESVTSGEDGLFSITGSPSSDLIRIKVQYNGYQQFFIQLEKTDWGSERQTFYLKRLQQQEDQALEGTGSGEDEDNDEGDVYTMLNASENPFIRTAGLELGGFRYSLRGLGTEWDQLGFNGFLLNDLDYARIPFYLFSGLTFVSRYSDDFMAYKDDRYDLGSPGVSQWITTYPGNYRKEFSVNLATTNRNYNNRLGVHYASGINSNGSSWIAGVNRRWAQEAYIPGTFYDAWGAYAGYSHRIGQKHHFNAVAIYAPVVRGKSSPGVQEVFDLSGDPYYNAYWGIQEGEKRNSREVRTSAPALFLNYRWDIQEHLTLQAGLMGMMLDRYDSQLEWNNAPDPRPDYYQKLPSYTEDSAVAAAIVDQWKNDIHTRQVNWTRIYNGNYNNQVTLYNVNGEPNSSISGKQALYWIGKRVQKQREWEQFLKLNWTKGRHELDLQSRIELSAVENYQEVGDLLGADFVLDIEDFIDDPGLQHPDVSKVNKIVLEGEKFGYHYQTHTSAWSGHLAYRYFGRKIDLNAVAHLKSLSYSRTGYWQNAIFESSLGKSNTHNSNGFGVKAVATWKLNGRNYIQGSTAFQELPIRLDQKFISPEWRAEVIDHEDQPTIGSFDLAYHYRSPRLALTCGAYLVQIENQIINKDFFLDDQLESASNAGLADGSLINAFYTHLDQKNMGIEGNVEYKLAPGLNVSATVMLGDHYITNRPDFYIYDKFSKASAYHTIYINNYPVYGSAQKAASLAVKYDLFKNGFVVLTANHLSQQYIEYNPLRRIPQAVADVDRNTELFNQIIDPEKLPTAFFINLFAYKSFKFMDQNFTASLSINNLLNHKSLINGGFEQFRYNYETKDPEQFPSKYFNFQGINYYFSITWRI